MKLLRNIKLSGKLLILLIISTTALLVVGTFGFNYTKNAEKISQTMYKKLLLPNQWLSQIMIDNRALSEYTLQLLLTKDPEENKKLDQSIKETIKDVNKNIDKYSNKKMTEKEQQYFKEYLQITKKLRKSRQQVLTLALDNKIKKGYKIYKQEVENDVFNLNSKLLKLQKLNLNTANKQYLHNKKRVKKSKTILISIILITLIITIILNFIISRTVIKPTNELKEILAKVEEGDLTIESSYQSRDELGALSKSFNNMIKGLREMTKKIEITSHHVASASEQLTASANQTTTATEHVAETIQQIASKAEVSSLKLKHTSESLQQVLGGVIKISKSSTNVSELSRLTATEAEEGNSFIENNSTQMKFIFESVKKSNQVVESLSHRSNEIGKIIHVISSIADQTNLLALNAAIEAARAGDHGKGFSVVAQEVRNLAKQSLTSTNTIGELIYSIQNDTKESVEIMKEVMKNAEKGIVISTETANKFSSILDKMRKINPQIEDITITVQQISHNIEDISSESNEVTLLVKENATSSEDVAASTEEQLASMQEINSSSQTLSHTASELNDLMKRFKI